MTQPTNEEILAALSTPIRDLRDEVWVRVYAAEFAKLCASCNPATAASLARETADDATMFMPIPAHRRPEGT